MHSLVSVRSAFATLMAAVVVLLALSPATAAPGDVTVFPTTSAVAGPAHLVLGPDGNVWFTNGLGGPPLGLMTPAGEVTTFEPATVRTAVAIATGSDGNIWFSAFLDDGAGGITPALGRLVPGTGATTTFTAGLSDLPVQLTPGPDDRLWFTDVAGRLGRVATDGTIEVFAHPVPAGVEDEDVAFDGAGNAWTATPAVPAAQPARLVRTAPDGTQTTFAVEGAPGSVTVGDDGNLWFGEDGAIGRMTPAGVVTRFAHDLLVGPHHLTVGGDGNVWFTAPGSSRVGRITPAGELAFFRHGSVVEAGPLVLGADGSLWYGSGEVVVRVRDTGVIRTFGGAGVDTVVGLTPGPGTDLWFASSATGLGSITMTGEITEHTAPAHLAAPAEVLAGPDGDLWFTAGRGGPTTDVVGTMTTAGEARTFGGQPVCRTAAPCFPLVGGRSGAFDAAGRLWFLDTENQVGRLGAGGALSAWAPNATDLGALTIGADGHVWFGGRGAGGGRMFRLRTDNGRLRSFVVPGVGRTGDTVTGADGNVWFVAGRHRIGRITPLGAVRLFGAPPVREVTDLAVGADGNVWFASQRRVGRVTPAGRIRTFASPGLGRAESLTAGPDGNVWFATIANPRVGRVTPTGAITFFRGGLSFTDGPPGLVAGTDDDLWVTSTGNDRIARVSTAGAVSSVAVGHELAGGLTVGPDGHLWFGVRGGLGRFELAP